MRKIGFVFALAVLLASTAAAPAAASGPSSPQAATGATLIRCTTAEPTSGYTVEAHYGPPEACTKCESAGRFWETTGKYKAWCYEIPFQANVVVLYLLCTVCRDDAGTTARSTRTRSVPER